MVARWMAVDPLSDMMRRHSPYNYGFNSPMVYGDPTGMDPEDPKLHVDLPEILVTAKRIPKAEKSAIKSIAEWIPVIGFGINAWDAGKAGNYTQSVIYLGLAVVDGLTLGGEGAVVKVGIKAGEEIFEHYVEKEVVKIAEEKIEKEAAELAVENTSKQLSNDGVKALGTRRDNLLGLVEDSKLKDIVNDLFRPAAKIGSGSSMDAYRIERVAGELVGGKSHLIKLQNYNRALLKLLKRKHTLSPRDKKIVIDLLIDISHALSGN